MELPENPTSAQLLDEAATIGLSAMEYVLKLKSAEQKSGYTSHMKSLNKGLILLGKEWNPELAKLVRDDLSTLKDYSENPGLSQTVQSVLLTNWNYSIYYVRRTGEADYRGQ